MIVQPESQTQRVPSALRTTNFVSAILPWLAAGAGLLVYLLTLNHWVSLDNLLSVARTSGWTWRPELYAPLYWLLTLPFHLLPLKLIPIALNLFSMICAVLSLALLARCVALLPHDRTHEQRQREDSPFSLLSIRSAWLPPLLAVVVCGLQLTFWENATATVPSMPPQGSGCQMLDLLLFAYIVRCLLEFRIDESQSWLSKAALVFGASMANNWAMIGFFPAYLMALVWIKGLGFFNPQFLLRMLLAGLAGLSLYLLLPISQSFLHGVHAPFWTALKANLTTQRYVLSALPFSKVALVNPDKPLVVLGFYSLLPVFLIGIRWPSYFGDTSRLGVALATWIVHLFYAVLLVLALWVSLDPQFSLRNYLDSHSLYTYGLGFLPFHFLTALSVGYFVGYFLLVFKRIAPVRGRPAPGVMAPINALVSGLIWAMAVITPVALVYRNLPQVRLSNGPMLHQYAALATQGLPRQGAVLLSDDPHRLLLAQAALAEADRSKDYVFVDTTSLVWPDYHRFLKQTYPKRWESNPPKDQWQNFNEIYLSFCMARLAVSNTLYYLHPSFGFYFENFYIEPHGLTYRLSPYPTNLLLAPKLPTETMAENETFWRQADETTFKVLLQTISPPSVHEPGLLDRLVGLAHLKRQTNSTALLLASSYSRALNYWGVEAQRRGLLPEAAAHFERAQELNPENVVASINLECNKELQAGRKIPLRDINAIREQWKYRRWDSALGENGPFDEPSFCFEQGRDYATRTKPPYYRQAAYHFDRAMSLAPQELEPRLWLAQMHIMTGTPQDAVKLVNDIHAEAQILGLGVTNQSELLMIEASSDLAVGDAKSAEKAVQTAIAKYPGHSEFFAAATQVYLTYGRFTNALQTIDQQLKLSPDNPDLLANKGYLCIQLKDFQQAIAPLTRSLELQTNNYPALLNRAIAFLRTDRFDDAQRDYEQLQKIDPTRFQIYYGLGEIAWRKNDTNSAVRNYELYLANSPPPEEAKTISERLKTLRKE